MTAPLARDLLIINKRGLHARFDAAVTVSKDGTSVGGTSIMGLMMLAASPGCSISVTASGNDAEAVLEALTALVADRFGEEM
jgi:phosphocarrier protein